jgi:sulfur carrier protein
MKITILTERTNTTETVSFKGKKVKELLKQLNINSETVLVVRNNEVITEDETLADKDRIKLLSVISGG